LHGNQIKVVKGLEKLVKLKELNILNNPIVKIDNYESLKNLWPIAISTDWLPNLEFSKFTSHFRPGRDGDYFPRVS
jgi:Leucine-rich repeat (LRR) protein